MNNMIRKHCVTIQEFKESYNQRTEFPHSSTSRVTGSMVVKNEDIHVSQRYPLFVRDNFTCVECGNTATHLWLERNSTQRTGGRSHLNLYGFDSYGNEILFTKDHIVPKSKGGRNAVDNYQCMCVKCNRKKGDNVK